MTDSPINLDEARSIIAVSKSRHAKGKGTTTDIDYRYLERIVDELCMGGIVPQAGDKEAFETILWQASQWNFKDKEMHMNAMRRYLTAIEGNP